MPRKHLQNQQNPQTQTRSHPRPLGETQTCSRALQRGTKGGGAAAEGGRVEEGDGVESCGCETKADGGQVDGCAEAFGGDQEG